MNSFKDHLANSADLCFSRWQWGAGPSYLLTRRKWSRVARLKCPGERLRAPSLEQVSNDDHATSFSCGPTAASLLATTANSLQPQHGICALGKAHMCSQQPLFWQQLSVQFHFNMVSVRSEKPICAHSSLSSGKNCQLSSTSTWYLCARKCPYALHAVFKKFPQRCLWNSPNVCMTDDGPLSSFQGRCSASLPLSCRRSMLWCPWFCLCPQAVSEVPQHFWSSETQAMAWWLSLRPCLILPRKTAYIASSLHAPLLQPIDGVMSLALLVPAGSVSSSSTLQIFRDASRCIVTVASPASLSAQSFPSTSASSRAESTYTGIPP